MQIYAQCPFNRCKSNVMLQIINNSRGE